MTFMESTSQHVVKSAAEPILLDAFENVEEATAVITGEAAEREVQVDNAQVADDSKDEGEPAQVEEPVNEAESEERAPTTEEVT